MRRLITFLLAIFLTIHVVGQHFEGQITYQNTFKSKMAGVTDDQWRSMMGVTNEYFIKGGNYRTNANGTMFVWQLYINGENKLYNKLANSETIFWNDGSVNQDEVLKIERNNNAAEILGYKCDELILTCKSGVHKYYFAPALTVETSLFGKHKFGNWSVFIAEAKSLPLKIVVENQQFVMESVATAVKPGNLDDGMFVLPAGVKTTKSPW